MLLGWRKIANALLSRISNDKSAYGKRLVLPLVVENLAVEKHTSAAEAALQGSIYGTGKPVPLRGRFSIDACLVFDKCLLH